MSLLAKPIWYSVPLSQAGLAFSGMVWLLMTGILRAGNLDIVFWPAGGGVLPGQTSVHFDFLASPGLGRNLLYWKGSNSVDFGPVPGGEFLNYSTSPKMLAVADGSPNRVAGFPVVTTGVGGGFHKHVFFVLYGDAARNHQGTAHPTDGIYLLTMAARLAGMTNFSNPFRVVLGLNTSEAQLEQAKFWVNENLAHPRPTQLSRASFSPGPGFGFVLSAPIGRRFFIEGTSDLRTWTDRGLVVSSNGETRVQLSSTNDTALFRVRRFEL